MLNTPKQKHHTHTFFTSLQKERTVNSKDKSESVTAPLFHFKSHLFISQWACLIARLCSHKLKEKVGELFILLAKTSNSLRFVLDNS